MTFAFPVPSFSLNVEMTLVYIPIGVIGGAPFDWSGDLSGNDETAYNNITWNDVRDKPLWSQILAENYAANLYYAGIGSQATYATDRELLLDLQSRVEALENP